MLYCSGQMIGTNPSMDKTSSRAQMLSIDKTITVVYEMFLITAAVEARMQVLAGRVMYGEALGDSPQ